VKGSGRLAASCSYLGSWGCVGFAGVPVVCWSACKDTGSRQSAPDRGAGRAARQLEVLDLRARLGAVNAGLSWSVESRPCSAPRMVLLRMCTVSSRP
jgi:hypothetical protein